jgi:hypothetical protein
MVSYNAVARGAPATVTEGAWTITLDQARLALGPIYFCATAAASESLCQVAVGELPRVVELDALSPNEQPLGAVRSTTGTIHSVMFDLGINWFATRNAPHAGSPLGHSARFEGRAEKAGVTRRFAADIDIQPQYQGSLAVNGVRLPSAQVISDETRSLRVLVDPDAWLRAVDWDELDTLPGDPIVLTPSTRASAALASALVTLAPTFEWR